MKIPVSQTMCPESGFRSAPNWLQIGKYVKFFWRFCVSLFSFSYWPKFHARIITGSGVMTIFVYKGLTKNLEIGNTTAWVFLNIWRPGQVMDTKFGMTLSNEMLLNVFNDSELLRKN